ncbi:flagellar biosynthetic protein FliO [Litoribacillus peritrichatus]|uniref:flagellar biosynthetic protein FliO n=1 Tax=Litoribacillus peritrichatus TaxID=718191 RepID=UPI0031DDD90E
MKNSYFRFSLVLLFLCSLNTSLASDVSVEDVLIPEEAAESSSDANVSKTNSSSDMAVSDSNASEKAEQSQETPQTATSDYVKQLMSDPQNPDSTNSHTSTVQLATTVAGLFAVIGMIFVAAWLVRRLSGGQIGQSNAVIKILATQALGTKERICLIDVGGQQVLVGITAQAMQTLMVLDEPIDIKANKKQATWSSPESVNSVFGAKLQTMLKGTAVNEGKQTKVDD